MKIYIAVLAFLFLIVGSSIVSAKTLPVVAAENSVAPNTKPMYFTHQTCTFTTYWPDGSVKRVYPEKTGYMHMNHLKNEMQCYLAVRRHRHVRSD